MTSDLVIGWLSSVSGIIPPFCVELVLADGARYFLHSVLQNDEATGTLILRIWDFRELGDEDITKLKKRLNKMKDRKELGDSERFYPGLDWANVRLHYKDIEYHIEWHDRYWPESERPPLGFSKE